MARLIPNIGFESIDNKPERDVAMALVESLPDNVLVYHSYPWIEAKRNARTDGDTFNEGEADFVIVLPEIGFLVLEVKGGHIGFDTENRKWYRSLPSGERRPIKDPFEQARTNTHVIKNKIIQTSFPSDNTPPCTFGYAVAFPDCEYKGTPPPGSERATILTVKDLPFMDGRIPSVLRKWCRFKSPKPMTKSQFAGVKQALNTTFHLVPLLSRQIEADEESLVRLTEEQARLLDFLLNQKRCSIEGIAGSGKTMLALEQTNRFARQGLKTLFVCYNKALADWIRTTLADDLIDYIDVYHFHGLCKDFCGLANIPFAAPQNDIDSFFRNKAPSLLLDAIDTIGSRYDALIVDEGQDFNPEWWLPLELLCHEGDAAPFFLFYDPAQNLFVDDPGMPDLGRPYPLSVNCRNTRQIALICSHIKNTTIKTHNLAPEGKKVRIHLCPDKDQQLRKCETLLKELKKGGLNPGQIVIQSPFRKKNKISSFKTKEALSGFQIVTDIHKWRAGEGVLFTTIRKFKGLEADVVIMVDIPSYGKTPVFTPNDFYVGVSRAKHVLEIVCRDENITTIFGNE